MARISVVAARVSVRSRNGKRPTTLKALYLVVVVDNVIVFLREPLLRFERADGGRPVQCFRKVGENGTARDRRQSPDNRYSAVQCDVLVEESVGECCFVFVFLCVVFVLIFVAVGVALDWCQQQHWGAHW